jgi:hypothetical protein
VQQSEASTHNEPKLRQEDGAGGGVVVVIVVVDGAAGGSTIGLVARDGTTRSGISIV